MHTTDRASEILLIIGPSRRVSFMNEAAAAYLGINAADAVGKRLSHFARFAPGPEGQRVRQAIAAIKARRGWRGRLTLTNLRKISSVVQVSTDTMPDGETIVLASDVGLEAAWWNAMERRARIIGALGTDKKIRELNVVQASERIMHAAIDGLGARRASIWLLSEGRDKAVTALIYDRSTGEIQTPALLCDGDTAEQVTRLARQGIVAAAAVDEHPALAEFAANHLLHGGIGSAITMPILREGNVIGLLICEDVLSGRVWRPDETQFCAHLADFTALTLEAIARRQTLHDLARTNQRLTEVVHALDSIQDKIVIQDSHKRITYVNKSVLDLLGVRSRDDIVGMRCVDLLAGYVERLPPGVRRPRGSGRGLHEIVVFSPTQGKRELDVQVSQLDDGGAIHAAIDATERKEREARERMLRSRLADAQRLQAIGSLAGGVAHDFNNIIGAIRGYADLLVADLPGHAESHRYAERILAVCNRAAALVREIMGFSRVRDAQRGVVAIRDLLADAHDILLSRSDKRFHLEVEDHSRGTRLHANATQISQIIANLILNAADAMAAGGAITLAVEVVSGASSLHRDFDTPARKEAVETGTSMSFQGSLSRDARYLRITVSDRGTGIPPMVLPHIFEPFYTTKEKRRGTGLGLAMVADIVEAHDGAIRVWTRVGMGTTFEIYLPAWQGEDDAPQPKDSATAAPELRGRERILIVDDEYDIGESLATGLNRLGYEAAPVFNPVEALEIFAENPDAWDVVISDQMMPRLSGLELIRKLRAINPAIKTIVCSGYGDISTTERPALEMTDAFFSKPVSAATLAKTVRGFFADRR